MLMAFYPLNAEERSVKRVKKVTELWFRSNRRIKKVNPDKILYCEYQDGYINVMLTDGEIIRVYNFLSRLENELEETKFFRIHRNRLVNLKQIVQVNKNTGMIRLKGNLDMSITPGRLEELELTINCI